MELVLLKNRSFGFVKRAASGVALASLSVAVMAQEATSPIDSLFDGVDFAGIATKVVAIGLVIVGIVVAFKGIDLVKRVIRKV